MEWHGVKALLERGGEAPEVLEEGREAGALADALEELGNEGIDRDVEVVEAELFPVISLGDSPVKDV